MRRTIAYALLLALFGAPAYAQYGGDRAGRQRRQEPPRTGGQQGAAERRRAADERRRAQDQQQRGQQAMRDAAEWHLEEAARLEALAELELVNQIAGLMGLAARPTRVNNLPLVKYGEVRWQWPAVRIHDDKGTASPAATYKQEANTHRVEAARARMARVGGLPGATVRANVAEPIYTRTYVQGIENFGPVVNRPVPQVTPNDSGLARAALGVKSRLAAPRLTTRVAPVYNTFVPNIEDDRNAPKCSSLPACNDAQRLAGGR